MSYILDALRKAEHGRQSAPTPAAPIVSEPVPQAPVDMRRRALRVLLLVAIVAVAVFALVRVRQPPASPPVPTVVAPAATAVSTAAAPGTGARPLSGELIDTRGQAAPREAARALDREALRGRSTPAAPARQPDAVAPGTATRTAPARPPPGTVTVMGETPVTAPGAAATGAPLPGAAGGSGNVPMYTDLLMNGRLNLPNLRMDMHVFNADPAKRFVFINLRKYREGERVEDRATVDTITRDGAVLSHNGIRFLLLPD